MTAYLKTSNAVTVAFLFVVAWHFGTVVGLYGFAPVEKTEMLLRLFVIVAVPVVSAFIASFAIQSRSPTPLLPDEREEKIERVSEAIGVLVIYGGILVLAWAAFAPLTPVQFVNGLIGVVAITELVKLLIVLSLHKRAVI